MNLSILIIYYNNAKANHLGVRTSWDITCLYDYPCLYSSLPNNFSFGKSLELWVVTHYNHVGSHMGFYKLSQDQWLESYLANQVPNPR